MINQVKEETVKKVDTFEVKTQEKNGFLIELFKSEDDKKTEVYLTCATPGSFKGYHLHKVRASRYVCIKGTMKVILYVDGKREEYVLDANSHKRLFIPPNIPTGLLNIGKEDGWLINYPDPAYDPALKGEQVDFTQEELDSGEYLKKL